MIESLENVYREHRQGLFTFALSIAGCPQLAEDAIQIAFTHLHRTDAIRQFASRNGQVVAYVFRSVRNSAIDLKRSDQRQKKLSESLFAEYPLHNRPSTPPDQLLTKERDGILREAIEQLSEGDREAIVLKLFAGLTFDQAGKVANTSPKTIATRYRRALGKLENQLKGQL
jgi:RNA polymerase sigma-70 factor (ECF subfamily)